MPGAMQRNGPPRIFRRSRRRKGQSMETNTGRHAALLDALRLCITLPGACCCTERGRLKGYYKTRRLDEISRVAKSAIDKDAKGGET